MPPSRTLANNDLYKIGVRQFRQRILPTPHPETTVRGYGSVDHPDTFNYPAFTIEATWKRKASNDPLPRETGFKDTVIAYPGEITRVKARFDNPGFYAWHCHIVEHEDNEMMRPYHIGPIPPGAPAQ